MPIDESYKVTRYAYRCEVCGRRFESDGPWAAGAVKDCEAECREKLQKGLVRVFLPPPGSHDTTFVDKFWKFVQMYSDETVCAERGHREEKTRTPYHDGAELEIIRCKRCGMEGRSSIHDERKRANG